MPGAWQVGSVEHRVQAKGPSCGSRQARCPISAVLAAGLIAICLPWACFLDAYARTNPGALPDAAGNAQGPGSQEAT